MALKVEAKGGNGGKQWDDGSDYEGVTKIHVRGGFEGIQFIKFDYVKAGKTIAGPIHGVSGRGLTQTFEINHLEKEYLLSVEGYYDKSTGVIQSIQFKTNKKTSDMMGFNDGTKFSLSGTSRSRIIGFHGFAENNLNSLGAYFIRTPSTKSAMQGGQTTGKGYDHGGDYDGIRKVYVTFDGTSIRHIRVDYDKAGQVVSREELGDKIGTQHEFTVNYPYEYITSVEGSYAVTNPYGCIVLRSLTFKTSNGRSSTIGIVTGTKFVLESQGNAIFGFHGRVGSCVDSIGAYYAPFSPPPPRSTKSGMEGGQTTGTGYDHGGDYDGIRKVYVRFDGTSIRYLKVDYDKAGQVETQGGHGSSNLGEPYEFMVNYPYEYITSVEGSYAYTEYHECIVLRSLTFKTSSGRTLAIGTVTGTKFVLESQGKAIVGFHGRSGTCVDSIGAYYAPFTPSPPPSEKLEGQGGDGGVSWDDGAFQNVKKIYIGQGQVGIVSVKFEYENNASEVVVGDEHGKTTLLGYEEFELDYPSEYITSVEAFHEKVMGAETGVITMLRFKTNKRTSPPFGLESGFKFVLEKEGHKITGFHGKSGTVLHQIGVHVVPITK